MMSIPSQTKLEHKGLRYKLVAAVLPCGILSECTVLPKLKDITTISTHSSVRAVMPDQLAGSDPLSELLKMYLQCMTAT
jgi:hypothetical protein